MTTYLILSLFAGMIAAIAMHALMLTISRSENVRVDMVRALGSLVTGKMEGALGVGLAWHLGSGAVFGLLYGWVLVKLLLEGVLPMVLVGAGLGMFQGLVVAYVLMYGVSEHHPVERFRKATIQVGFIHLLGHIFYGALLGLLVGIANQIVGSLV